MGAVAAGLKFAPGSVFAAEEKKLNFYNWDTYIGEDTLSDFKDATGIDVTMDLFADNDELFAKLREGNPGYDVIFPSNDFVERLVAEVEQLADANELWEDPAYVRAQARERLNYVLPGEVGLVVLGTQSTPPEEPATGAVLPAAAGDQPWWSTLLAAFDEVGAGEPGAAGPTDPTPADTD